MSADNLTLNGDANSLDPSAWRNHSPLFTLTAVSFPSSPYNHAASSRHNAYQPLPYRSYTWIRGLPTGLRIGRGVLRGWMFLTTFTT